MKTVTVNIAAYGGRAVTMREPTIRDLLETQNVATPLQRSVELLGRMILDDAGKSIGVDAVMDMPSRALTELSLHMQAMTDDEGEAEPVPLARPNGSGSVSPAH